MDSLKDNTSDEEFHDCLEHISDARATNSINDLENLSTVCNDHNLNGLDNDRQHFKDKEDTQIGPSMEESKEQSKANIEYQIQDGLGNKSSSGNESNLTASVSPVEQNKAHRVSLNSVDCVGKQELLDEGEFDTETSPKDKLVQDPISDCVHECKSKLITEIPLDNTPTEHPVYNENAAQHSCSKPANEDSSDERDESKSGFTTGTSPGKKFTEDSMHNENADEHSSSKSANHDNDKEESSGESEDESHLTTSEIEERTSEAKKLKNEGNDAYNKENFEEAIRLYSEGIKICPKCSHKDRAILYSNRSACYTKMDRTDDAIQDCTSAISLHPLYLKVYLRRAQLYDKTEKYEEAAKDYEKILEIDPSIHSARKALMGMPEKIEVRNEKLKQQMMSSLKDLGNLFLRPFGLSTDNFQMQQNADTGSYNIQFNNNPGS